MKAKFIYLIAIVLLMGPELKAQFLMDMMDTTTEIGKGMISIYKKYDHLRFSGYIQPQFQLTSRKGAESFGGGNFAAGVNNRFLLRRSRVRIDYVHFDEESNPGVQFVFQFDANERGFTVRDVWGRIFENKLKLFSFTTGIFARPFGYEVNLSSSDRESPERGRMSQTLMKSERDLGAMVSLDNRNEHSAWRYLKIDAGIFNGQGINGKGEYDNTKDIIGRVSLKPKELNKKITLSAGASVLYGGLQNITKYHYSTLTESGIRKVKVDSATTNIGRISPRRYYGADMQLKFKTQAGTTELRGEYISGQQSALGKSSETPTEAVTGNDGYYTRRFNGAYFYFLHNIFSTKHQLLVKYDWYDPNTKVSKQEIAPGVGFSSADIKYNTIGIGYIYYITPNVKSVLYYSLIQNEPTLLPGYETNLKIKETTIRFQFRF